MGTFLCVEDARLSGRGVRVRTFMAFAMALAADAELLADPSNVFTHGTLLSPLGTGLFTLPVLLALTLVAVLYNSFILSLLLTEGTAVGANADNEGEAAVVADTLLLLLLLFLFTTLPICYYC